MNDYFTDSLSLADHTRARVAPLNALSSSLEAAFDRLPPVDEFELLLKKTVTAGGTANALTVANATPIAAYTTGQRISFIAAYTNTNVPTLNVDGLGVKSLRRVDGTAAQAGDIVAGRVYDVVYDGSYFQIMRLTTGQVDSSVAAAASSATAAATSATNAAASATAAAGSATSASSSASTATTQATNASNSATAAAASEAAVAANATAAAGSASSASTSASTATTQATNAANSASAASTSATNAANSATAASGSATSASTSAGTATTQATNASNSATAAAGSASAAATSATAAQAAQTAAEAAALPNQTGKSGQYLRTNGTSASWVKDFKETVFAITDGASVDIDPANGGIQTWTLGASRTPTATNFAAGQSVTLLIDDGSAYAITWTGIGVTWLDNAAAPTLQTSGYTIIELFKVGSTIYGMGRR